MIQAPGDTNTFAVIFQGCGETVNFRQTDKYRRTDIADGKKERQNRQMA